jgi:hypothetical protein
VTRRARKKKVKAPETSDELSRRLRAEYDAGDSLRAIGKREGLSHVAVRRRITKAGGVIRDGRQPSPAYLAAQIDRQVHELEQKKRALLASSTTRPPIR